MSDKKISSANKDISLTKPSAGLDSKSLIGGLSKDVQKRWKIVGAILVVVLVLASGFLSGKGEKKEVVVKRESSVIETTPKGMSSQKDWKTQTAADMQELRKTLNESQQAQREMLARMEAMRQEVIAAKKAGPAPVAAAPMQGGLMLPPPPPEPKNTLAQSGGAQAPSSVPPGMTPIKPQATTPQAPAEVKRAPARSFIPAAALVTAAEEGATVTEELVPNENRGLLPGGSFAAATMISGVEAFTDGTAQSRPQPIVVRLDANALLPNAANYHIKGCHVLASVWGDLSSERVFGRLATLTCVDSANRLVLSEEVEGVIVDSDGKNGIRGTLQDRQGAKLARSLLAGFAEGMASAFGAAQSTVSTTALGTTSSVSPDAMMKVGAYGGAKNAAEQLANFYMKQAESTMPVIAVDAGRKVSVLFTKSKSLKFETTDQYRVKPKDKLNVQRKLD